jgi:sugar lactone lactonase YvrE
MKRPTLLLLLLIAFVGQSTLTAAENPVRHWLWSTAHAIPKETVSEGSGYFSIVEGANQKLYIGTAKYGHNAYLVEFDPATKQMKIVVDAHKEIGTTVTGFAAQAKIHTRNNVGKSGRIYIGTKQGYPLKGEKRSDYLGGYPMVYDPMTGKTRVYDIPVPHQGIISLTPDESRGIAYLSTSSDGRPIDDAHFMVLDLEKGTYKDLLDTKHMYAFIVVDWQGRAYHPIRGGEIARYDPRTDKLERLKQTIDGQPPTSTPYLAHEHGHPINWEISPDRKTLYSVAMSENQLYSYDLTAGGNTLKGRRLGPLIAAATKTDCRAMCVASNGTVWAGVRGTFEKRGDFLHVVSWKPGDKAVTDHGPIAISNPKYTEFTDAAGKPLKFHHGVYKLADGTMLPRYAIMGISAHSSGAVYVTTLYPFTVHEIRFPKVAGVTTEYRHNSHSDVILGRMLYSDTLDDKGPRPEMQLASLFTDQVPAIDTSRKWSKQYGFPIHNSVRDTLTLGGDKLAVDGVFLIAEHGDYPESATGQIQFPKRRLFGEIAQTFRATGQTVPVFCDKHLADNWKDAKWLYDTARELEIPLMAGSSLPLVWRDPPVDVKRDAKLQEIVAVSYHRLDSYGFHALEIVQCLAERRAGGETGVQSIQCLTGDAVWEAEKRGVYDRKLLDACLERITDKRWESRKLPLEKAVREPVLFAIRYLDGLKANILTLDGAVVEWAAAWRYADGGKTEATLFHTQELRPFGHFAFLVMAVERLMQTGRSPWPVERTLLTTGLLDALLISKQQGGKSQNTPWLKLAYQSDWNWTQPPPEPPGRDITKQ